MARKFLELMFTDSVRRAQTQYYGRAESIAGAPDRDPLGPAEAAFIAGRDSFYLGSISEAGWPYIQHRGGPRGFLRVVNEATLAFADYRGNRQMLTTGNLSENNRVALFLMDYPNRTRLKILGHARIADARARPDLVAQLSIPNLRANVERIVFVDVVSFDWNCPQYITPRFSLEEIEALVKPLGERIAELESKLHAVGTALPETG